jgi:hypothetical protein
MKKNLYILAVFCFFVFSAQAQLVNNGAVITVKDGATLVVDNDVNNTSGTITLEGSAELKVSGDFTNGATFTPSATSTLTFYGDQNSQITSNAAVLGNLLMDKTSADLIMLDPLTVETDVTFNADNNLINLGDYDFILLSGAAITNAGTGTDRYFQADGSGSLRRGVGATGVYDFPIGDANEYSPLSIDLSTATIGTTDPYLKAKVVDASHPSLYGDADAFISRYWITDASDITAYTATLTGNYTDADIDGTESLIKGASYVSDWSFDGADGDDVANTVSGDVTDLGVDFTGKNFYGRLASLKTFLQGAYSGTTMTTDLTTFPLGTNDGDHFPDTSPYGTGETITSIPASATDWIKIEVRDAGDASSVVKSYGKFIKNDGQIIEADGSSTLLLKDAPASGYIAIRHRNHLGIRTGSALDLVNNTSHDFSTASSQAYGTNPLVEVSSGVWGMWGGNVNGDDNVKYAGANNDAQDILNDVLNHPNNVFNFITFSFESYSESDVNMDKTVKYAGTDNDAQDILNDVLNHPNNVFNFITYTIFEQL